MTLPPIGATSEDRRAHAEGFDIVDERRLTVQSVPAWIYPAVYPAWFLSEKRLLDLFANSYELVASFHALDRTQLDGDEADYKGFIFRFKEISLTKDAPVGPACRTVRPQLGS